MTLEDHPVLLLDIQATAAAVAGGVLLEIGWQRHPPAGSQADGDTEPRTYRVRHTRLDLPPRLSRLTGLTSQDLRLGTAAETIWERLCAAARATAQAAGGRAITCPVVIHYARFESPFIDQLRTRSRPSNGACVELDIVCTHEIARRLLPGLPRKGLRAVAGYFGHDTHGERRCSHHLNATRTIWTALAAQLANDNQIMTLPQLKHWLKTTPVPPKGGRHFLIPSTKLKKLPNRPGVYRLLSQAGTPLYVGKAKVLNQRVRTYFQPHRRHADHILEMLSRAAELKTTPTCTALEAALLEQDLIKKHAPVYNHALRGDGADLCFWSRDFASQKPQWDAHHPWGPIPGGAPTAVMAPLVRLLNAENASECFTQLQRFLMGPEAQTMETACLQGGLDLFRQRHGDLLAHQSPGRALLAIGRRVWGDNRIVGLTNDAASAPSAENDERSSGSDDGSTQNAGQHVKDPVPWTAARVCRHLEHSTAQVAGLLRRSRWLALLGNATLTWKTSVKEGFSYRSLRFRRGRVIARHATSSPACPEHRPRGCSVSGHGWRPQDKTAYDRLRVATTELRRLVKEERFIAIQPDHSRVGLGPKSVARLLEWI